MQTRTRRKIPDRCHRCNGQLNIEKTWGTEGFVRDIALSMPADVIEIWTPENIRTWDSVLGMTDIEGFAQLRCHDCGFTYTMQHSVLRGWKTEGEGNARRTT